MSRVVPGVWLEVDDFELGVRDGAATGEEARVGRVPMVADFMEAQIVQEPKLYRNSGIVIWQAWHRRYVCVSVASATLPPYQ